MGEQSIPPNENGFSEEQHNNDNMETNSEEESNDDTFEEDMTTEEFEQLDNQLDALNSALDDIEQKNDNIHAQLLQLLHANREIRQQLQETNLIPKANVNVPK
ncbi:hypothetical protein NQ315_004791 [Exocentrus adspersus]|uniref:Uncharacterized protein n=1 Tax=Exocentrus adspersus TaxID=1586481 RepID=A0AAV8W2Y5_9CUCU|nr:hypothetical protein NQ315_004791 [Exocentrus adspersus]